MQKYLVIKNEIDIENHEFTAILVTTDCKSIHEYQKFQIEEIQDFLKDTDGGTIRRVMSLDEFTEWRKNNAELDEEDEEIIIISDIIDEYENKVLFFSYYNDPEKRFEKHTWTDIKIG